MGKYKDKNGTTLFGDILRGLSNVAASSSIPVASQVGAGLQSILGTSTSNKIGSSTTASIVNAATQSGYYDTLLALQGIQSANPTMSYTDALALAQTLGAQVNKSTGIEVKDNVNSFTSWIQRYWYIPAGVMVFILLLIIVLQNGKRR